MDDSIVSQKLLSINNANSYQFFEKTSLKIFKHYKLKPSFSIVKDDKTKDRAGVGDKPPPPSFVRSINPNFIQKLIRTEMEQFRFDPIWSILIQLDMIGTDYLIWFDLI